MAKNTAQMQSSYKISAIILFAFFILFNLLGCLIYLSNPNLESNQIMPYILDNFTYPGLKGLFLIGILALAMSTADSQLNAGSVSFSHDFCMPLGIFKNLSELTLSRIFSVLAGIAAIFLATKFQDLICLILFIHNFYAPVITVPLLLAIFGFKASTRAVVAGIICGMSVVIFWSFWIHKLGSWSSIDSFIPGMLAHFFGLMSYHYLIDKNSVKKDKEPRQQKQIEPYFASIISRIKNTLSIDYMAYIFTKNLPKGHLLYNNLAIYVSLLFFITFIYFGNLTTVDIAIFFVVLIFSALLFLCNFIQSETNLLVNIIYFLTCIFCLPFSSIFLLLYTNFSHSIIIISIISFVLMPTLMSWEFTIIGFITGLIFAIFTYEEIYGLENITIDQISKNEIVFTVSVMILFTFLISRKSSTYLTDLVQKNYNLIYEKNILGKKLETAHRNIEKLVDLKTEVLNNFSHEIRTPLQKIGGYIDIAIESSKKSGLKDQEEILAKIDSSFKYLEKYILKLADLSGYQKNAMLFEMSDVDISELILTTGQDYKTYLDVRLHNPEDIYTIIRCDKLKIQKVIREVLENSILHAKSYLVDVEILKTKEYLQIIFKDYATNPEWDLDNRNLKTIFEPFEIFGKGEEGYRGIGLALGKEIINAHKGRISADIWKGDDEKGFILKIEFPLNEEEIEEIEDMKDDQISEPKKFRILLVDDEEEVLKSSSLMLEFLGHEVFKACCGIDAINFIAAADNNIDIIFLDIMMPDKSGIEVLKEVGDIIKKRNIKVVIQSGAGILNDLYSMSEELGISAICPKPYKLEDLKRIIDKF